MENLLLWAIFVCLYLVVYEAYFVKKRNKMLRNAVVIALLALPLNINGNVFTIIGNITDPRGIKNMYSIFSLVQTAENNTYSVASVL